jgi:O-antigen/teichoic acid export membrane protein
VAVQTLAQIPYQAILAITFVIFPLVSRATFEGDREKARAYVATTLRYTLLLAGLFGVCFLATPTATLLVPYRPDYAVGGPALGVLAPGTIAFALLAVSGTILNGAGRPGAATASVLAAAAVMGAGTYLLAGRTDPLVGTAAGATAGFAVGLVVASVATRRHLGGQVPVASLLRVGAALAAAAVVGHLLPDRGKVVTLVECVVVELVYLVALVGTGELGRADLERFRKVLRRRA